MAGFFQNIIRYADLAQVMKQGALLQDPELLFIQTEKLAKQH